MDISETKSIRDGSRTGAKMGYFDYNDTGLGQPVTPATSPVFITNDELGAFTNKSHAPIGITDVWDALNNQFDWGQLKFGDTVDIRLDLNVTTNSPNQEVDINLRMAIGSGGEYIIPFSAMAIKSAGVTEINKFNSVYMGDANTLNFPAKFEVISDGNATVNVLGWYCRVIRQ